MSAMTDEKKGLTKHTIDELLNRAFAITHKMHALDKAKVGKPKGDPARKEIDTEVDTLRDRRDIIVREIKRRTGDL